MTGPGDRQAASAAEDVFEERLGGGADQLGDRLARVVATTDRYLRHIAPRELAP